MYKQRPQGSVNGGGDNVVMTVGERVDGVRQQIALIIVARQTDFAHDARGDMVIS